MKLSPCTAFTSLAIPSYAALFGFACVVESNAISPAVEKNESQSGNNDDRSLQSSIWKPFTRSVATVDAKTPWFSEEGSGWSGNSGGLIYRMHCDGRYCDNMFARMRQRDSRSPFYGGKAKKLTRWFSEETSGTTQCLSGYTVKEIQCSGRYCDNLRFHCQSLGPGYRIHPTARHWTAWFSEEGGSKQCNDGYYMTGGECSGRYCDNFRMICRRVEYNQNFKDDSLGRPSDSALARKFAPMIIFDKNSDQYPMSLEKYWSISKFENGKRVLPNYSPSWRSFNRNDMGVSYTVVHCNERTKIVYHIFYKGQRTCGFGQGDHEGDWERVTMELTSDFSNIYRVRYNQHSGFFTRGMGHFPYSSENGGIHPKVYVGKNSNGSYNDDGGSGGCAYWEDYRNVGNSNKVLKSWKEGRLENTDADKPWNIFKGSFGRDGYKRPEHWHDGQCNKPTCKGSDNSICSGLFGPCGCGRNRV